MIDGLRKDLLDRSIKNPLLNFDRKSGAKRVWFVDFPSLDAMVAAIPAAEGDRGRGLEIKPVHRLKNASEDSPVEALAYAKEIHGQPMSRDTNNADDKKSDLTFLQSEYFDTDLNKILDRLRKKAVTYEGETGLQILHLCFGFMEWRDPNSKSEEMCLAPLLTIPVRLQRIRGRSWGILLQDEDPVDNPTLREKLTELGLMLPELNTDDDAGDAPINAYLVKVAGMLADHPEVAGAWRVRFAAALGTLSFAAIQLWADLGNQHIRNHRLVQMLMAGKQGVAERLSAVDLDDIVTTASERVAPTSEDLPVLVFDADSSQHAALVDVLRQKRDVVIEGPPGTGKSQTIANLIAAAIGEGRTVLFVSQKLAALRVVHDRLRAVGLGDVCLDLFGQGTAKSHFLKLLRQRRKLEAPHPRQMRDTQQRRNAAWAAMARHAKALNQPVVGEDSAFDLLWASDIVRHRLGQTVDTLRRRQMVLPTGVSVDALRTEAQQFANALANLKQQYPDFPAGHGFDGIVGGAGIATAPLREKLKEFYDVATQALIHASFLAEKFRGVVAEKLPLPQVQKLKDLVQASILASDDWKEWGESDWIFITSLLQQDADHDEIADLFCHLRAQFGSTDILELSREEWEQRRARWAEIIAVDRTLLERQRAALKSVQEILQGVALPDRMLLAHIDEMLRGNRLPDPDIVGNAALEWAALAEFSDWDDLATERGQKQKVERQLQQAYQIADVEGYGTEDLKKFMGMPKVRQAQSFPHKALKDLPPSLSGIAQWAVNPSVKVGAFVKAIVDIIELKEGLEKQKGTSILSKFHRSDADSADAEAASDVLAHLEACRPKVRDWLVAGGVARVTAFAVAQRSFDGVIVDPALQCLDASQPLAELSGAIDAEIGRIDAATVELRQVFGGVTPSWSAEQVAQVEKFLSLRDGLIADGQMEEMSALFDWDAWLAERQARLNFVKWVGSLSEKIQPIIRQMLQQDRPGDAFASWQANCVGLDRELRRLANVVASPVWAAVQATRIAQERIPLSERSRLAWELADATGLHDWITFQGTRATLHQTGGQDLADAIEAGEVTADQVRDAVDHLRLKPVVGQALELDGVKTFSRVKYEDWRSSLITCDAQIMKGEAARVLAAALTHKTPAGQGGRTTGEMSELCLLEALERQQRPRMHLRTIMGKASGALRALFPCFMMSPLSVAQYLRPGLPEFDLIVFDEASQLPVAEGIGALARAKQVVVVGDENQMPPSSLFKKIMDDDDGESEDETLVDGAKSILEFCQQVFPRRRLLWHYRSRHEGLIQFSNQYCYDNDLIVFPAGTIAPDAGIHYHQVAHPTYAKQKNAGEAAEVIELAIRLMMREMAKPEPDRLTLGIVAMNAPQVEVLEEILQIRGEDNCSVSDYIDWSEGKKSPFFIKSLENVQGDERDIIVISLTYGASNGKFHNGVLGSLNRDGGWRRLNVLITRAKQAIYLVSSIERHWLKIPEAKVGERNGVAMLRQYLERARYGSDSQIRHTDRPPDSPFEEAVCGVLDQAGIPYTCQLGVGNARLDIAIRHPDRPGEFVLAVECDGARYHSARSRRDADRLRQERLESMGWKFHRIWSTDWFNDRKAEEKRLLDAIQGAIRQAAANATETDDVLVDLAGAAQSVRLISEMVASETTLADTLGDDHGVSADDMVDIAALVAAAPLEADDGRYVTVRFGDGREDTYLMNGDGEECTALKRAAPLYAVLLGRVAGDVLDFCPNPRNASQKIQVVAVTAALT